MKSALCVTLLVLSFMGCAREREPELSPAAAPETGAGRLVAAIADARCRQAARCGNDYPEIAAAGGGSCMSAMENDTYAELTRCVRPIQREEAERCVESIGELDCGTLGALRALKKIYWCSARIMCGD